jgi:hypothetical protein
MRTLISVATAALAVAVISVPAYAASHHRYLPQSLEGAYGSAQSAEPGSLGFGTGPYWQGEPTDRQPIWRYGYYQGNDPDNFIRSQLMRDPRSY